MKNDKKVMKSENQEVVDKSYLESHGRPVTRREMLRAGAIQFAAAVTLPSVYEWLARAGVAEAAECAAAAGSSMPAFVHLAGAGGFAIQSQFIAGTAADHNVLLPHYGILGMGSTSNLMNNGLIVQAPFKNKPRAYANSGLVAGLTTGATAATLANAVVVVIPTATGDDSNNNKLDPSGVITKAGVVGNSLPNVGTTQSPTGGRHQPAYVMPPAPLVVGGYSDLARAIQVSGALGQLSLNQKTSVFKLLDRLTKTQARTLAGMSGGQQLAALTECATGTNLGLVGSGATGTDPRDNTGVATAWGINGATADSAQNLVFGSMVYNALKGNAGTVNLVIGGCDYHGRGRPGQDATDTSIGLAAGRILETARIMGKKLFLMISTDGAVGAPMSDTPGAGFTSDRGVCGGSIIIAYDPAGKVEASSMQIGGITTGQGADSSVKTGGSAEMNAAAVFANYLSFAGQMSKLDLLGQRPFSTDDLTNQIIKITG